MENPTSRGAESQDMLRVERQLSIPDSISAEAKSALAELAKASRRGGDFPPLEDKASWRALIAQTNEQLAASVLRKKANCYLAKVEMQKIAGVTVYVAEPENLPHQNASVAALHCHGGGLVLLGGECTMHIAKMEASNTRARVLAPDFRTPPDHPYPAALDDCVAVYQELLHTYPATRIVITGSSGGGNLAAAVTLKLRDLGVELPAALALFTPEVDLTESGDSFQTNRDIDAQLPEGLHAFNTLYANGHDLRDPLLSPLFADFAKGFPPTFIQAGTRDLFLSNAVRMHRQLRRAGVETELFIGEAMPHGGFGGATPEDREMYSEFRAFLSRHAGWASEN